MLNFDLNTKGIENNHPQISWDNRDRAIPS